MVLGSVAIPGVEVLEELGRGAHGAVFRVRREGRFYAAKVPLHPATGADQELVARRFFKEAIALARVRHRALPRVMEVGRAVGGTPYLILELAVGETLAQRLRSGPLDELQVLDLASELAEALTRIHQSGLSHRDITTANILFDSATTAVRLVDFGFAERMEVAGRGDYADAAFATFADARADLFALGQVLFECLTGARPFPSLETAPAIVYVSRPFGEIVERLLGRGNDPPYSHARELLEDLKQLDRASSHRTTGALALGYELGGSPPVPLLGRERELERLRTARRMSAAGHCLVTLVRGVRGSGKSAVLRAFAEEVADSSSAWFAVGCKSFERAPFGVVRQIVEAVLDAQDRLPPGKRLTAIAKLRSIAGDMAPLLRLLSPRLARVFPDATPLPRGQGAEQIFSEGLTEFLSKLFADLGPVVVFVDDIQWLDAGSRRVLGRLTDRATSSVLYVLSARDEKENAPHIQKLTRSLDADRVWEIELRALDEQRVVDLIQEYLGSELPNHDLIRYVGQMSDGTPLSVLEILRSMLEAGVLVPSWGSWNFDARAASSMGLPRGSLELVGRRIATIEPSSARALSVAAVLGSVFDEAWLVQVCRESPERIRTLLSEAHRAALIEPISRELHRFTHDSVREALLERLGSSELRALHEAVAEAMEEKLEALGGVTLPSERWMLGNVAMLPDVAPNTTELDEHTESERVKLVFALASHYVEGERTRNPGRVAIACTAAAQLAFRSFDNEPAIRYFEVAAEALRQVDRQPDVNSELALAEARLRTGALDSAITLLRGVVDRADDPVLRAYALSRIARAEMQSDTERAWATLREAFAVLGVQAFSGKVRAMLMPAAILPGRALSRHNQETDWSERRRLSVLSELYYQATRLAADTGESAWLVESVLKNLEPAERLGSSPALNKAYLTYSFLLATLGARAASRRYLKESYAIAAAMKNPIVTAFTLQVHGVIAAWSGDLRESLDVVSRLLEEYAQWREVGEYCVSAVNAEQIESVRGRTLEGWKWLERAVGMLTKYEGSTSVASLEVASRASLTALAREQEANRILARLGHLTQRLPSRGIVSQWAYGAHVRVFTEKGDLGAEFEELVAEVQRRKFDPSRVHLGMKDYYVHVAHARVHACIRAPEGELKEKLEALRLALADLKRAAKIPLLHAHVAVIAAYEAFWTGRARRAERLFARAEALGRGEGAPWVLYAVHRGRAHMLLRDSRLEDARDQARLAEALAREHGAAYRVRWVREEFSLRGQPRSLEENGSGTLASRSPASYSPLEGDRPQLPARTRGYLRSLVQIGHSTAKELALEHQVRVVLDELIEVLRAERGYLFLSRARLAEEYVKPPSEVPGADRDSASLLRNPEELALACGRSAAGELLETGFDPKLVEDLWVLGNLDVSDDGGLPGFGTAAVFGERAVVATPLVVRGGRLGAVYLDRPLRAGPFSDADARLLAALGGQVSLVIELARSLRLRERAEETQRGAEKLEAIGRLAGGIAHDFNNMLSVILGASDQLLSEQSGHTVEEDVETIRSAAERARDLTRQLLAFSRGQYLNPEVLDLNQVVGRLEPIFRRLASSAVRLEIRLDPELCRVKADPAQIDQVLTNLVVNACDAMPSGGKLLIETRSVVIRPNSLVNQARLTPGRYARIVVSDTGQGMDEGTRAKAFEPFFTTKPSGSGLGLATAYGIVTQSGGHIELESRLGSGTTFRIFFPQTVQRLSTPPPTVQSAPLPRGSETILLVDDEPLVRESTRRMLSSLGYTVIPAKSSDEALKLASDSLDSIDLVISDVIMPGMNGLELARELAKIRPGVRVLFVSGFTAGVLTEPGVLRDAVEFLQKPVALDTLASRIRTLVDPRSEKRLERDGQSP